MFYPADSGPRVFNLDPLPYLPSCCRFVTPRSDSASQHGVSDFYHAVLLPVISICPGTPNAFTRTYSCKTPNLLFKTNIYLKLKY